MRRAEARPAARRARRPGGNGPVSRRTSFRAHYGPIATILAREKRRATGASFEVAIEVFATGTDPPRGRAASDAGCRRPKGARHLPRRRGFRGLGRRLQNFLDRDRSPGLIRGEFRRALDLAATEGPSVVIGHPYDETLEVLREEVPLALSRGFRFVTVGELLRDL